MTGTAADVLASIDGALAAYGTVDYGDTGCSMRWRPEPPVLVICGEGQPLWPLRAGLVPDADIGALVQAAASAAISLTAGMEALADGMAKAARAIHDLLHAALRPHQHKRCLVCNPRRNPGKLAVDGHEYHRRQKARQKRKRR